MRRGRWMALGLVLSEKRSPAMPDLSLSTQISVDQQRASFSNAYNVLEQAIDEGAFPGAAFGVLSNGRIVLMDAVGAFTHEEDAAPIAVETVFDIASLTKVVATTSAAMILHDRS